VLGPPGGRRSSCAIRQARLGGARNTRMGPRAGWQCQASGGKDERKRFAAGSCMLSNPGAAAP